MVINAPFDCDEYGSYILLESIGKFSLLSMY